MPRTGGPSAAAVEPAGDTFVGRERELAALYGAGRCCAVATGVSCCSPASPGSARRAWRRNWPPTGAWRGAGQHAVEMARRLHDRTALAVALHSRHWLLWARGSLEECLAVATEIVRLADAEGAACPPAALPAAVVKTPNALFYQRLKTHRDLRLRLISTRRCPILLLNEGVFILGEVRWLTIPNPRSIGSCWP